LIVDLECPPVHVDGHGERGCPATTRELPDRPGDNGHQITLFCEYLGHPVDGVTGESPQSGASERIGEQKLPFIDVRGARTLTMSQLFDHLSQVEAFRHAPTVSGDRDTKPDRRVETSCVGGIRAGRFLARTTGGTT
jgi:hypothetical protein